MEMNDAQLLEPQHKDWGTTGVRVELEHIIKTVIM
jgi:hypothetical protein